MISKSLMNLQKHCVSAEIITNHSLTERIKHKCGLNIKRPKLNQPARQFSAQMPSPMGLPIIGTALSLMMSGGAGKLHIHADERHKKYGPIFKEKLGNVEAVFISKPEYIRAVFAQEGKYPRHVLPEAWVLYNDLFGTSRGLFFMDSEEWLFYRRMMNKCLLQKDTPFIDKACLLTADITSKNLGSCKNLETELYKWSLETISAVLIGADKFQANHLKYEKELINISQKLHLIFETSAKLQFVPAEIAAKLNLKIWKEFVESVDEALHLGTTLVQNFITQFPNNDGLLGMLVAAGMRKDVLLNIVIDLVLAAGDTTAYTMQWVLYNLAKHKSIQNKLHEDLEKNENSGFKNFIRETLRLYPVAPFITRFIPNDINIGDYLIEKDSLVLFSLCTAGRDESVFKDASSFDPERWNNKSAAMVQASLPFAMGSRSCIGKKIADAQLSSTLKAIVAMYEVDIEDGDDVEMILKMVGVPSKPIKLKCFKRCK